MRRLVLALVAAAALPLPAAAQSLFNAGGLGLPLDPLDARARSLGSVGVGLPGGSLVPADPAAAGDLALPTVSASMQPVWGDFVRGGDSGELQGTRFPLLGVGYPVGDWGVATLTFGGFLDQRWQVEREATVELAGQEVPVVDRFVSDGGVSTVQLGFARPVGERAVVAFSAGAHMGQVSRRFTRSLDSLAVGAEVAPHAVSGRWRFTAPTASLSAGVDPIDELRVAASVTWSGDLEATPVDGTGGASRAFRVPMTYRLGASGRLTPRLALHAGLSWADWSDTGSDFEPDVEARAAFTVGGGVEWDGPRLGQRTLPVRLGYRRAELPFGIGSEEPVETVLALGFGLRLSQVQDFTLAGVDVALERGSRDSGLLSESFRRATFTIRLSGG